MVKVNNSWIDEEEVETENVRDRELRLTVRTINEVMDLMRERDELYEVRLVHELQDETRRIERLKKELEHFLIYETHTRKGEDVHVILDLCNVIGWIEEEQEKYKL